MIGGFGGLKALDPKRKVAGGALPSIVSVSEYRHQNTTGGTESKPLTVPVPGGWRRGDVIVVWLVSQFAATGVAGAPAYDIVYSAIEYVTNITLLNAKEAGTEITTSTAVIPNNNWVKVQVCILRGVKGIELGGVTKAAQSDTFRIFTSPARLSAANGLQLVCAGNGENSSLFTAPQLEMVGWSGLALHSVILKREVRAGDGLGNTVSFGGPTAGSGGGAFAAVFVG